MSKISKNIKMLDILSSGKVYSYNSEEEINKIIKELGYKKIEAFYGDLNRKSFFIEDNNGNRIQLIEK